MHHTMHVLDDPGATEVMITATAMVKYIQFLYTYIKRTILRAIRTEQNLC